MNLWQRFAKNAASSLRTVTRAPRIAPERRGTLWPLKGWIAVAAIIAMLTAVASMIVLDAFLINEARDLPRWLRIVFIWITWFGNSAWFLWPTGLLLILFATTSLPKLTPFYRGVLAAISIRAGFIFCAVGVPALFVTIIKRLIGRARPYVSDIVNPFSYDPLVWREPYASLPSGHATNAFAAAVAIGALWPKARLPMWIFAVVIAISRVILTAHYPSDVIAGAIAGTIGALLVRGWFASRRLAFIVGSDAAVHRLPGPSWRRTKVLARRLWGTQKPHSSPGATTTERQ